MKTICWDVDDVLNNLMYEWFHEGWIVQNPTCKLKYEELSENPPTRLLNIHLNTYLESLDRFREKYGKDLKPNQEILDWFEKYGSRYRHIALSAVPVSCAHISAEWTLRHFGKWIRSFNFVPSIRSGIKYPEYDLTKADYLKKIEHTDIIIEDNEKNILDAENISIKGLLIKRPWNNGSYSIENALQYLTSLTEGNK